MRPSWLTPANTPTGTRDIKITVPDGLESEAAVRGALLLLLYSENWEDSGGLSVEETLESMTTILDSIVAWEECSVVASHVVGEVFFYAGDTPPANTLICDGREVSETEYPELAAICGDTYGGASAGNFRIPYIAGRGIIGAGQRSGGPVRALGELGGNESVILSVANGPAHDHTIAIQQQNINVQPVGTPTSVMRPGGTLSTSQSGSGSPINTMNPYTALTPLIWAK